MKICVVSTWFPHWDGVALYSARLHQEVARYVHVEVLANKIRGQNTQCQARPDNNIVLSRVWKRGSPLCLVRILVALLKSRADIFHINHGWLLYGNPVIAFFFPFFVLLLRRLSERPVIVTMHTIIRKHAGFQENVFYDALFRIFIFSITKFVTVFSSKVVVHNELMKRVLVEDYGCKKDKIHIIPHGVERAEQVNIKTKSKVTNPKKNILSIGFFREDKGFEILIEAFKRIREDNQDIRLVLVGTPHPHDDQKYVEKVKEDVDNLRVDGSIVWENFISEKRLSQIIHESTIITLLSQNKIFVESSGALARIADFGKPLICNRVPKFQSELTNNYDCIMVPPRNPKELYIAIATLLRKKALKMRIAKNLKEGFSSKYWSDVAREHITLYENFLQKS